MISVSTAPPLDVTETLRWTAIAWAVAAFTASFGGNPAHTADITLTLIALALVGIGKYDPASWVYLSSAVPWMIGKVI